MSRMWLVIFLSFIILSSSCDFGNSQRDAVESVTAELQSKHKIIRLGRVHGGGNLVETTLINFHDRIYRLESIRPDTEGNTTKQYYLQFVEVETGNISMPFGNSYALADAVVTNNRVYVFATQYIPERSTFGNYVTMFSSEDMLQWNSKRVFETNDVPGETIFNVSITRDLTRWVMVYETNDYRYQAFTMKFAESSDLEKFSKMDVPFFRTDRYTGAPYLVYSAGYYYFLFLSQKGPAWSFETHIARSKDLRSWEYGNRPFLIPNEGEMINTSDVAMLEYDGITLINYSFGDQKVKSVLAFALYAGKMQNLLESFFK